jgi:hypothetical protein
MEEEPGEKGVSSSPFLCLRLYPYTYFNSLIAWALQMKASVLSDAGP